MASERHEGGGARSFAWSFGKAEFDEGRWVLSVDGAPVELERKPLEVLQYLLRHAGEAVTKDELLSTVWAGRVVVEAVLTNAIGKLRRALGDEGAAAIVTLPRVGYRFEGKVTRRTVEHVPPGSRLSAGDPVPRRGNWVLEQALARHGDGEVWLARHAKTGEARVFKFSLDGQRLPGLKREVTVGRLLKQALGEQPGFVDLHDWNFEEAPYFVEFEYGGEGLDRWTDAEGWGIVSLPLEARLSLFVEAVDAVEAAHAVGVLHKDLKPANMLVHGGSDELHLRVVDFGSSGVFDSGRLDDLGITRLGLTQALALSPDSGTPLYLAPEVLAGQVPTIRSDVYALGVVLYQLVVGDFRRPLAAGWEADVGDRLLREDIAAAANGNPALRPASAALLADRIRTLAQRREKAALEAAVRDRIEVAERRAALARARRPWVVSASVLLVMGMVGSLFYAGRARDAELRANASLAAQTQLNQFLTDDVIGATAPDENEGRKITMMEALDNAESRVSSRFQGDAGSEGTVRASLARAYNTLGDANKVERQYALALPLLATAFGTSDERYGEALIGHAHASIDLGRLDEAGEQLDSLSAHHESALEPGTPAQMRYHYLRARAYLAERRNDYKRAAEEYGKVLELTGKHPELGEDARLKAHTEYGTALLGIGNVAESERQLSIALAGLEQLKGRLDSRTIQARQFRVQALMQADRMPEALEQIDTLEVDMRQTMPESPSLANVNTLRAMALVEEGRNAEAAHQYGEASRLFATLLGEDSPFTLSTLQYQAEALRWAGQSRQAADALEERLETARRVFKDPSPALAEYAVVLALAQLDVGRADEARALLPLVHIDDGEIADDVNVYHKPRALLLVGRLLEAEGLREQGLEKYQSLLSLLPDSDNYRKEAVSRMAASSGAVDPG